MDEVDRQVLCPLAGTMDEVNYQALSPLAGPVDGVNYQALCPFAGPVDGVKYLSLRVPWMRFNVKPCVTLQGLWMGFLTACGSLARTLGPIFVAQIYDAWGPRVTFASTCAILAVTIGINCATYRRLVPFATSSYRKRSSDQGGGSRNGSVHVDPTGSLQ